jgi:hypothetical protein
MTFQNTIKVLLVSAAALCCVCPANAQMVYLEASGTVDSFHGGFGSSADLGQSVTLDFSYDSASLAMSFTPTYFILSAPIASASIVSGVYGSGINLESNGPGTGFITDTTSLDDGSVTSTAWTSIEPPSPAFTGSVFGFSLLQSAAGNTLDLIRDVYNDGKLDLRGSGLVSLSNISVGEGVAPVAAPEIDASSAASALTLLLGGLAVVRGRRTSKIRALTSPLLDGSAAG